MHTRHRRTRINQEIVQQASAWFVDFRVGDVDERMREAFTLWLRRSPEHIQAYLELSGTYATLAQCKPAGPLDVPALIAAARSRSNVHPLASPTPARTQTERSRRPGLRIGLAASVLLAVAGLAAWVIVRSSVYSTAIGEQRSITLADGSTMSLNARSRARVRFSQREREVDLLDGQALFQVARDSARPFVVRSGGTLVRAVGTQFDVHRKVSGSTVVTVVEGRVAVTGDGLTKLGTPSQSPQPARRQTHETPSRPAKRAGQGGSATILLAAGEQLTVAANTRALPVPADVTEATAWTQRKLIFKSAPLSEVADEFNRFSTRQLIVSDPQLAGFHISGVYSSTSPASLVRFLREQPGIVVTESESGIEISGSP